MDRIIINGGIPLTGRIRVAGAKNAALPLMCAALLTSAPVRLENMPNLADIRSLSHLLAQHGVETQMQAGGALGHSLALQAETIVSTEAPYELVRKMRASVLVLGPLLARCGQARVSLPGGCAIGARPVDLHLKGMEALGAKITLEQGYIAASAPKGLKGAEIIFPTISVGATENIMMAACLAEGQTRLINAAREPEIVDLAKMLMAMGAKITGAGTDVIEIRGVTALKGCHHEILPDRIEAGSLAMAVAATGGRAILENANLAMFGSGVEVMQQAGLKFTPKANAVEVEAKDIFGVDVMTEPHPGFPTDLQAQIMAMLCSANGASMITESIFENRYMHVPELLRMGANIALHGRSAIVRGVTHLKGAEVMATDLRASMSLVIAGLVAQGETIINRVYHLDRGYEKLEEKLMACGAKIKRVA